MKYYNAETVGILNTSADERFNARVDKEEHTRVVKSVAYIL